MPFAVGGGLEEKATGPLSVCNACNYVIVWSLSNGNTLHICHFVYTELLNLFGYIKVSKTDNSSIV